MTLLWCEYVHLVQHEFMSPTLHLLHCFHNATILLGTIMKVHMTLYDYNFFIIHWQHPVNQQRRALISALYQPLYFTSGHNGVAHKYKYIDHVMSLIIMSYFAAWWSTKRFKWCLSTPLVLNVFPQPHAWGLSPVWFNSCVRSIPLVKKNSPQVKQ